MPIGDTELPIGDTDCRLAIRTSIGNPTIGNP